MDMTHPDLWCLWQENSIRNCRTQEIMKGGSSSMVLLAKVGIAMVTISESPKEGRHRPGRKGKGWAGCLHGVVQGWSKGSSCAWEKRDKGKKS